jgi:ferrochelatase
MSAAPVGVLLANLGTPDAPTTRAVRRYLAEFLSDRRVVDVSPLLWRPILHGWVLRTRPRRSAALYRRIWTAEGSPLLTISRRQQEGLAERLGDGWRVELGMRYGNPSIAGALDRLAAAGCRSVVVLPAFPQFSSATTSSVFDAVAAWARPRTDLPALAFVRGFAEHPAWVLALRETVRAAGVRPTAKEPLVVSFHGLPRALVDAGDPYASECEATAGALAASLGLPRDAWRVAYQSRFGRRAWLEPALDDVLRALAADGARRVAVVAASFVADCLETIDEIGHVYAEGFRAAGGEALVRVPCPNDGSAALDALAAVVQDHVPPRP